MQNKRHLNQFQYEEIYLKLLEENDLADTLIWRNANRHWFNDTSEVIWENHRNWFQNYLKKDNEFVFIVEDQQNNKIGQVSLYCINWETKSAEFGRFLVNPAFAGRGYMKLACSAVISLGQTLFSLELIRLEVKENNEKAIHIYLACGFIIAETSSNGNLIMEFR